MPRRSRREDVGKVTEPKAQALFETSAEVLTGKDFLMARQCDGVFAKFMAA